MCILCFLFILCLVLCILYSTLHCKSHLRYYIFVINWSDYIGLYTIDLPAFCWCKKTYFKQTHIVISTHVPVIPLTHHKREDHQYTKLIPEPHNRPCTKTWTSSLSFRSAFKSVYHTCGLPMYYLLHFFPPIALCSLWFLKRLSLLINSAHGSPCVCFSLHNYILFFSNPFSYFD